MADRLISFSNIRATDGQAIFFNASEQPDGSYTLKVAADLVLGDTMTITGAIVLGAGEAHAAQVGGHTPAKSVELTRAANVDAYIAGDVVLPTAGGLVELPLVGRVVGGTGYITEARLLTDKKSITPRIRLHIFNASNPTISADNASHQEKYADAGKRLGYIDFPEMTTGTDATNSDMSRAVAEAGLRKHFACAAASQSLWLLLEALDGFTPASGQKFTIVLCVEQN